MKAEDATERNEHCASHNDGNCEDDVEDGYEKKKTKIDTITEIYAKTNMKRKLLVASLNSTVDK